MIFWKIIPEFPNYEVSSSGKVRSRRRRGAAGILLRPREGNKHGHKTVVLYAGGRRTRRDLWIHRLVLEAFVGPCPDGMECRHLNGNPADNRLENLCWGTHAENMRDRVSHGTSNQGERNGRAKLSRSEVVLIKRLSKSGTPTNSLAKMFQVSRTAVYDIVNRRKWKHV